jgi:dienelactone hydrolase
MPRKQASHVPTPSSWPHLLMDFVETNPKLAAAIAFELGNLAGEAVAASSGTARALAKRAEKVPGQIAKMPQQIADAMPDSLQAIALRFLPGPSPKLAPRKRSASKTRRARKAKSVQ